MKKKLKAEVKFNENLTINEIEDALYLLKNNKAELEIIYNEYFTYFRQIIEVPNRLITFYKHITLHFPDTFIEFISTYFEKELELYVINCNKEMHYYALYSLLHYKDILSESFLDFILQSLKEKIRFGIETLNLKPKGLFSTVDYLSNPLFYRCITTIETLELEDDIIDLINISIEHHELNDFYFRIFFALGDYKNAKAELSDVIKDNKKKAIENGIREKNYIKGGTVDISISTYSTIGVIPFIIVVILILIVVLILSI